MKRLRKVWKENKYQLLFIIYVLIMIKLIVFKYPLSRLEEIARTWQRDVVLEGLDTANFTPFKTIKMYIRYYSRLNSFENLFGNILVFVPFGYLLPKAYHKYKNFLLFFANSFLFVTCIEVFQLFSAFGAFDVDDFILNCAGACIGYLLFWLLRRIRVL